MFKWAGNVRRSVVIELSGVAACVVLCKGLLAALSERTIRPEGACRVFMLLSLGTELSSGTLVGLLSFRDRIVLG